MKFLFTFLALFYGGVSHAAEIVKSDCRNPNNKRVTASIIWDRSKPFRMPQAMSVLGSPVRMETVRVEPMRARMVSLTGMNENGSSFTLLILHETGAQNGLFSIVSKIDGRSGQMICKHGKYRWY